MIYCDRPLPNDLEAMSDWTSNDPAARRVWQGEKLESKYVVLRQDGSQSIGVGRYDVLGDKAAYFLFYLSPRFSEHSKEAFSAFLAHGFLKLDLGVVLVDVHEEDRDAIKLYTSFGFKPGGEKKGTNQRYFVDRVTWDTSLLPF
jgi:RimJ/RimL family protein N-acetyltransferase